MAGELVQRSVPGGPFTPASVFFERAWPGGAPGMRLSLAWNDAWDCAAVRVEDLEDGVAIGFAEVFADPAALRGLALGALAFALRLEEAGHG